jgi:hypothetical protein
MLSVIAQKSVPMFLNLDIFFKENYQLSQIFTPIFLNCFVTYSVKKLS